MSYAGRRGLREKSRISHSFDFQNILTDPFAISTLSISFISWFIELGGSIAATTDNEPFPRFTWWGIAYQLLVNIMLIIFYCCDLLDYYKLFLTSAMGVAFIYNSNSTTNLIYSEGSRKAVASAGAILLSIINFIWMVYFGGDNASPLNRWIDSFSMASSRRSPVYLGSGNNSNGSALRSSTLRFASNNSASTMSRSSRFSSAPVYRDNPRESYVASAALSGFEHREPSRGSTMRTSSVVNKRPPSGTTPMQGPNDGTFLSNINNATGTIGTGYESLGLYSDIGDDTFNYTARALYSYHADESDQYEISFDQGEILKVSDIEGRWWKARRQNGETGIIPSNYVQLIDNV